MTFQRLGASLSRCPKVNPLFAFSGFPGFGEKCFKTSNSLVICEGISMCEKQGMAYHATGAYLKQSWWRTSQGCLRSLGHAPLKFALDLVGFTYNCFSKLGTHPGRWFPLGFPLKPSKKGSHMLRNPHMSRTVPTCSSICSLCPGDPW